MMHDLLKETNPWGTAFIEQSLSFIQNIEETGMDVNNENVQHLIMAFTIKTCVALI